jgi:hypothetical protein
MMKARNGMTALQASPNPPANPGLRLAPTWAEQSPALQAYFQNLFTRNLVWLPDAFVG